MMCGLRRLHYLLRSKIPKGFFQPRKKRNETGSGDAIEGTSSSVNYNWGLHASLMTACQGHDDLNWDRFRLFYLTKDQAHSVHRAGLQVLTCSAKSYAQKTPLRGCEQNCALEKCKTQPHKSCLLYKYVNNAAQRRAGRAKVVQHAKMLLRCSTKPGKNQGRGWIYAGSHNLSGSAWGACSLSKDTKTEQKEGFKRNRVNHWEMGILLTDVAINDYENVVPWDRSSFDNTRYDIAMDVPYCQ
jgi:hypothetical protein